MVLESEKEEYTLALARAKKGNLVLSTIRTFCVFDELGKIASDEALFDVYIPQKDAFIQLKMTNGMISCECNVFAKGKFCRHRAVIEFFIENNKCPLPSSSFVKFIQDQREIKRKKPRERKDVIKHNGGNAKFLKTMSISDDIERAKHTSSILSGDNIQQQYS